MQVADVMLTAKSKHTLNLYGGPFAVLGTPAFLKLLCHPLESRGHSGLQTVDHVAALQTLTLVCNCSRLGHCSSLIDPRSGHWRVISQLLLLEPQGNLPVCRLALYA